MNKIYYLGTCSTCTRIINELSLKEKGFDFQDIKKDAITKEQLAEMAQMAGSYEALFSRVALKYKALKLNEKVLSEKEYESYILGEYTFLKRPVIIIDKTIYIGNSKNTITQVKEKLTTV